MSFESALGELERVTEQALKLTDLVPAAWPDLAQVRRLLLQREALILQLPFNTPCSPDQGERLKLVYAHGQTAEANLEQHRHFLLSELSAGAAQRAYADCMRSLVRNAV